MGRHKASERREGAFTKEWPLVYSCLVLSNYSIPLAKQFGNETTFDSEFLCKAPAYQPMVLPLHFSSFLRDFSRE